MKLKALHHTQIRSYHLGHVLRLSWQKLYARSTIGADIDFSEVEHLLPARERHVSHFTGLSGYSSWQVDNFLEAIECGEFIVILNETPSWWPVKMPFRFDEHGKWYYKSRGDSCEDGVLNFILHKAKFNSSDFSLETDSGGVSE